MVRCWAWCRMQLLKGEPVPRPGGSVVDYAWLTRDEVKEAMPNEAAQRLVQAMLSE